VKCRSGEAEDGEERPAPCAGQPQKTEVEEQDIAEESGRTVDVRRDQNRCGETTEEAEDGYPRGPRTRR
jgi:hypothetical protein